MPSSYCWGDRHTPARILDESDAAVVVEVEGATRTIPVSKIVGRVSDGDRIQILVSGGAWLWGHAQADEAGLWVVLDGGRHWVLRDARWIRIVPKQLDLFAADNSVELIIEKPHEPIIELAPLPDPDNALAQGDRIRIVLAGKPLEDLTGALGTVEGAETFGFIPVLVDGHGSGLFRREALGLVDSAEFDPLPYLDIPFTFDPGRDITKPEITIGTLVRHQKYWPKHIGVVKEIQGAIAALWFRDGVPLYYCGVESLAVVE